MDQKTETPKGQARAPGIQVIARAADVLRALKNENTGLSLGAISAQISLPRSTVQRIVNALVAEGLVMNSSPTSGYQLGPEIQSLAQAGRIDMADALRPILMNLSKKTGETVDLALVRGDKVVFVDQVVGSHRLRTVSGVGEVFPMTTTANGKAAMSLLNPVQIDRILHREMTGAPDKIEALTEELQGIREGKLARDETQHSDEISALGFAFKATTGQIYAISVPVPSYRFEGISEQIETLLLKARDDVLKQGL